jgi:hypothetical protein
VVQSNAKFNSLDKLVVVLHSVKMPVGFGRVKTKGRPLSVMSRLTRSIVEVKAEENCLAHPLIIAIAKLINDPNYESYRRGNKIRLAVRQLFEMAGIDLTNGAQVFRLS